MPGEELYLCLIWSNLYNCLSLCKGCNQVNSTLTSNVISHKQTIQIQSPQLDTTKQCWFHDESPTLRVFDRTISCWSFRVITFYSFSVTKFYLVEILNVLFRKINCTKYTSWKKIATKKDKLMKGKNIPREFSAFIFIRTNQTDEVCFRDTDGSTLTEIINFTQLWLISPPSVFRNNQKFFSVLIELKRHSSVCQNPFHCNHNIFHAAAFNN